MYPISSAEAQMCGGEEWNTIFADPDPAVLARGEPSMSPWIGIMHEIVLAIWDEYTYGVASRVYDAGVPSPPSTASQVQEILWIVDDLADDVIERIYDRLDADERAEVELDLQAVYLGIDALQAHQGLVAQTGAWAAGGYSSYEPMLERLRIALQGLDDEHNLDALHSLVATTNLQLSMVPLDHFYTALVGAQIWYGPISELTPEEWEMVDASVLTGIGIDSNRILVGPSGVLTYARGLDYDSFADDRFGLLELVMTRESCGDHELVKRWEFDVHGLGRYAIEMRTECGGGPLVVRHRLTLLDPCDEPLDEVDYFMHNASIIQQEIEGLYTRLQARERDVFLVQQYGTIRPQLDAWGDLINVAQPHLPVDDRLTEVVLGEGWGSACTNGGCTAAGHAAVAFIEASRDPRSLSNLETRALVDYIIAFGYPELEYVVAILSSNPFIHGGSGASLSVLLDVLSRREFGSDLEARVRGDFAALFTVL